MSAVKLDAPYLRDSRVEGALHVEDVVWYDGEIEQVRRVGIVQQAPG
jgi:hypothetical protein